jgi:hypothetical protein
MGLRVEGYGLEGDDVVFRVQKLEASRSGVELESGR